jgi:peroxiredoxin Q/BCP
MTALAVGAKAPPFALAADGKELQLNDFAGRKLVLYFYPKDDTPGCTKEAIGFTEAAADFARADTVVIGVSKDSVASHAKFKAKHGLAVELGADPAGAVVEAYGAWVEKSMYGRKYMGIERCTYLIGRDGVIAGVWRNVKVPGHVAEVLKAAQALA